MSTAQASHVVSNQRIASGRLWWVGLLTIITAVVVNILILLVVKGLFSIAPTFFPLQIIPIVPFTVIGSLGAIIVFALLARFARRPITTFQRTLWIVLLVSFIPDLLVGFLKPFPGTTALAVGSLMLMHLATAMICLNLLPGLSRARS